MSMRKYRTSEITKFLLDSTVKFNLFYWNKILLIYILNFRIKVFMDFLPPPQHSTAFLSY